MIEKSTILVVDDTPDNISLITNLLKNDYKTKIATNGVTALKIASSESPPDLILLDIMMPEMDGYEVLEHLQADPKTKDIPVIFLTAKSQTEDEEKGLSLGAVDYIVKPISPPITMARIKTHLTLKKANEILKGDYLIDMRFKVGKISIEEYFHEESAAEEIDVDIVLSPDEEDEIKKSCMEISDEKLRNKIIHLKEESLKREKYLSRKGYKKCRICGALYERSEGSICRICENNKSKNREEKVFRIFSQNPYAGYEDIQNSITGITRDDYKRYKQKKLDKIYRRAYFLLTEGRESEAIQCLYNYFLLLASISYSFLLPVSSRK